MLGSGQTRHWEGHPQVPDLSSFGVTMENIEPQEKLLCLYNIPILVKIEMIFHVSSTSTFLILIKKFFICLSACVSILHVSRNTYRVQMIDFPGPALTGSCELPNCRAGNTVLVL